MSTRSQHARWIGLLYLASVMLALGATLLAASPLQALPTAAIDVNSTNDVFDPEDGACTLREAIDAANTNSTMGTVSGECPAGSGAETDVINVPAGIYTLTIPRAGGGGQDPGDGDLDITENVTINGAGSAATIIRAANSDRVFETWPGAHVTLSQIQIQNGVAPGSEYGGGLRNQSTVTLTNVVFFNNSAPNGLGGGLYVATGASATLDTVSFISHTAWTAPTIGNVGTLTFTHGTIELGTTTRSGGGIFNQGGAVTLADVTVASNSAGQYGGGIWSGNGGALTLNRVTIRDNQVSTFNGGGIWSESPMTLTNVTLSNNRVNTSTGKGGAIFERDGAMATTATLLNVTVYSNTASTGGGIYHEAYYGGQVFVKNTIIANSASGGTCGGLALTSQGYNLDSANTCGFSATGDLSNQDPLLGPLALNDGETATHALLAGSPAIDHGTNSGCPSTDQRGVTRPKGLSCDIGAYEAIPFVFLPAIRK